MLARRVQHYGHRYVYSRGSTAGTEKADAIPSAFDAIRQRLVTTGHFSRLPDQLIINEYTPGQGSKLSQRPSLVFFPWAVVVSYAGIGPHVDDVKLFDNAVASITLGSGCVMDFSPPSDGDVKEQIDSVGVWLAPCSLVVLKDDARYKWRHSIAKRKADRNVRVFGQPGLQTVARGTRVSLTFRTMKST